MAISDFLNIGLISEFIAFVAALVLLRKQKEPHWRFFIIYLLLIVALENYNTYLIAHLQPTYPFSNFMMIVQVVFFTVLFSQFKQTKKFSMGSIISLIVFMMVYIAEGFIRAHYKNNLAFIDNYQYTSRVLLSTMVTIQSCLFFYNIMKEESYTNPLRSPNFWVVIGLFVFYFGTIPLFAFTNIISQIRLSGNISFYTLVTSTLSVILYGSWITAFVWKRKQQK